MRHASKIQDATLQRTRAARGNGNNDNNNNRAREISVALPRSWKVPFPLSSRKKKRRNKSESFQESDGGYRDRLFYVSLIFFLRWNYENGESLDLSFDFSERVFIRLYSNGGGRRI